MHDLTEIYEALRVRYGDLRWWPAQTPYEVMVGAVLTQNTAWTNVEKAIGNFGGNLSPQTLLETGTAELAEIIRPAGFFNQKAGYLKALTRWFAGYHFDLSAVRGRPLASIRAELLAIKGVGNETADSIMLYAFGYPTFVVDAYTARLCERFPIPAGRGYGEIKAYFEGNLPRNEEIYNNFHAMIVVNAKEHCRKKPRCRGCPLYEACGRRGNECASSPLR